MPGKKYSNKNGPGKVAGGGYNRVGKRRGDKWLAKFFDGLEEYGLITHACAAGLVCPTTVYKWKKEKPDHKFIWKGEEYTFAQAWEEAIENSTQMFEKEALRRAFKGCKRDIYYKGVVVGEYYDYSDTLAIFMLKSRRPRVYRDNYDLNLGGSGNEPIKIIFEDAEPVTTNAEHKEEANGSTSQNTTKAKTVRKKRKS